MYTQIRLNSIQYYAERYNKTKTDNSGCIYKYEHEYQYGVIQYLLKISVGTNINEHIAIVSKLRYKEKLQHFQIFSNTSQSLKIIKISSIVKRLIVLEANPGELWMTEPINEKDYEL
jgi:hypothetical protein